MQLERKPKRKKKKKGMSTDVSVSFIDKCPGLEKYHPVQK
jgi:hypothetical protein